MFTISCDPGDLPPAAIQALRDAGSGVPVLADVALAGQMVLTGQVTGWHVTGDDVVLVVGGPHVS